MKIDIKNVKTHGFVIEVMAWTPDHLPLRTGWVLGQGTHIYQAFKEGHALLIPMSSLRNYAKNCSGEMVTLHKIENEINLRSVVIFPDLDDITPMTIKRFENGKNRMSIM